MLCAADPSPADCFAALPGAGVVVQVGATDGAFLAGLAKDGKRIVQGLALNDAVRASALSAVHQAVAHPLATVATWDGAPDLPYADRVVNLLIVDREALGAAAPSEIECRRVVAPGGAILAKTGGAWVKTSIPVESTSSAWTHFDGGADGNALSTDTAVDGLRSLQWLDNNRDMRWAKTGPHGGDGGNMRVWGRYVVIDVHRRPGKQVRLPPDEPEYVLECRDVSNGALLWAIPRDRDVAKRRWGLAVADGFAYALLKSGEPLSAIDLATGTVVRTYAGSANQPWTAGKKIRTDVWQEDYWVRVSGSSIVVTTGGWIRCFDRDSGAQRWSIEKPDTYLTLTVIDAVKGRIYAIEAKNVPRTGPHFDRGPMNWGRWNASPHVEAIVCHDLTTGANLWRHTELRSVDMPFPGRDKPGRPATMPRSIGQILPVGDHVVLFNSKAISGGEMSFIASLRADTGATVHFEDDPFKRPQIGGALKGAGGLYAILARDGIVYAYGGYELFTYNPQTGAQAQVLGVPWNARCHKAVATPRFFLLGQTAFIDAKTYAGEMFAVARSGCAHSPVVGAGLTMFGPHECACVTHFDGHLAISPQAAPAALPDSARLRPGTKTALTISASATAPSLHAASWDNFTISEPSTPISATAAGTPGWTFAIDPVRHRVDAKGPAGSWSFVGDARLGRSVAVADGVAVIGSHDGYVHGIELATGAPKWRLLVAPARRQILVNGMLTSQWPVFGVADLGGGKVVASAGMQPEMSGGIRVAIINAKDGTTVSTRTLSKTTSPVLAGGNRSRMVDRSFFNCQPSVDAGSIVWDGRDDGGGHMGRFVLGLDESDAEASKRLSSPPPKK